MRHRLGMTMVTIALGLAWACARAEPAAPPVSEESLTATVERWRSEHEDRYRQVYATIAGLHPLKTGPNTAGSDASHDVVLPASAPSTIGRFVLEDQRVRFEPVGSTVVTLNGNPVTTAIDLRDDSSADADELVMGDVRTVVHVSGDTRMIRVRDPNGPLAQGFLGFSWFPIDKRYRVTGRFHRDARPTRLRVANTFGDLDEFTTDGVAEFTLLGDTLRLRPFTTRPGRLWFVFRDASSGEETYEAARFLYADLLDDGTTVLDFNMAYNPPCAFNPYTTCPIPLPENRLPIKILAGEKDYGK